MRAQPKTNPLMVAVVAMIGFFCVVMPFLGMTSPIERAAQRGDAVTYYVIVAAGIFAFAGSIGMAGRLAAGYWIASVGLLVLAGLSALGLIVSRGFVPLIWTVFFAYLSVECISTARRVSRSRKKGGAA